MSTLGDLARAGVLEFSDGYRTRRDQHASDGFRILRAGDVRDGRIFPDGPDFVGGSYASAIGVKAARAGDVVLTTKGTVGRTALVTAIESAVVYSPQVCFFRTSRPDMVDLRFLHQWLSSPEFVDQAGYLKSATDMAPYISLKDLASTRIELPPLSTQRAIAEVLGALDDKIAANAAISRSSEALLTAEFLNLQAQQERMRPWRLDELVDLNPRCAPVTAREPIYVDMQKLPTIGAHAASWDRREARGGARFMKGDTLLARITPCLENRKTGFVDFLGDGETGIGSTEFIVLRSKPGIAKSLSFLIAVDQGFRAHAIQHMVGTSGRQRVAAADLAEFEFRLPSDRTALLRLGSRADALLALGAAQSTESRRLAELRDTLLPHLMSGRITVREAEKQVEEAV